jgi:hypothetical protein
MWDLWWDKVALGQVFSEYFGFPCNRHSLHQLLHNHPHVPSGECTIGQCGRSAGTYRDLGDMKQRDLRNQNQGDLKKGPNGGLSPTPQKNSYDAVRDIGVLVMLSSFRLLSLFCKNTRRCMRSSCCLCIAPPINFGLEAYEFTLLAYVTALSVYSVE